MKIERIDWIDSCGPDGWHHPEKKSRATKCVSIGIVTAESKKAITVTSTWQVEPRTHLADLTIPKVAITRRRKLEK